MCFDLIGPYTITDATGKEFILKAMTMVDPATGWFDFFEIPDRGAETTALVFDRRWLSRYPRPKRCIFDNGNACLGNEFQEMLTSF